jgi:hypothetical protein
MLNLLKSVETHLSDAEEKLAVIDEKTLGEHLAHARALGERHKKISENLERKQLLVLKILTPLAKHLHKVFVSGWCHLSILGPEEYSQYMGHNEPDKHYDNADELQKRMSGFISGFCEDMLASLKEDYEKVAEELSKEAEKTDAMSEQTIALIEELRTRFGLR